MCSSEILIFYLGLLNSSFFLFFFLILVLLPLDAGDLSSNDCSIRSARLQGAMQTADKSLSDFSDLRCNQSEKELQLL